MKIYNSNIGRAKLRREQLNRVQNKAQFNIKKSLSKRIIQERAEEIEKRNNFNEEFITLMGCYKGDELLIQIMHHLKFGAGAYPSIFDDDYLERVFVKLRGVKADFMLGIIDGDKYIEVLEIIDELISEDIHNISNGQGMQQ